jgi:hypothetical protein
MEDELLDEDSSELDEMSDEDELLPLAIIIALSSGVKNSTSFMSEQEMNANATAMPAANVGAKNLLPLRMMCCVFIVYFLLPALLTPAKPLGTQSLARIAPLVARVFSVAPLASLAAALCAQSWTQRTE